MSNTQLTRQEAVARLKSEGFGPIRELSNQLEVFCCGINLRPKKLQLDGWELEGVSPRQMPGEFIATFRQRPMAQLTFVG